MRTSLAMLAAASTVVVFSHLVGLDDPGIARRDLEAEVRRVRTLVEIVSPAGPTSDDKSAELCLKQLDQTLVHVVSPEKLNGAPWMWDASHRIELTSLVRRSRPVLDSMIEWAEERQGRPPIPTRASLLESRHRTNLLCAAAVIETDAERRRALLGVALDLALAADDGGVISGMIQRANVGIVALAVRTTHAERGKDELLVAALRPRLECVVADPWPRRAVHDIVEMVERKAHVNMDVGEVNAWTRFLVDLQSARGADATSIVRWPWFLRATCSSESKHAYARNLEI